MIKIPPKHIIRILHLIVWIFLFMVAVSIQLRDFGFQNAMIRTSINLSIVCVLFYLHFYLINQFFEKRKFIIYGIFIIAITVMFTLMRTIINEELIRLPVEEIIIDRTLSVWLFGIFTTITALVLSFLYQMVRNRYKKEKTHLSIINEQNEAKIQYLKAQINPHFLFNSLNNIYSLSVLKSDQTPEMVLKLSSLLRYAIYEGEKNKVPLEKEVEQIKEFISLFNMKSEEDLNVEFNISGNINTLEIEPMLLIPLVENCFKHGGFDSNSNAYAKIDLTLNENAIKFSTKNLMDNNQQKDSVGGVGLSNIKKRLEVNYGTDYNLITKEENGNYIVELEIIIQ